MKKQLLFLLLLTPLLVTSQIPEPEKGTYVNDQYGYLHDSEKAALNQQLRYIEDSTGVQVAIILIPAVPDKYSIEEYANQIGRKWHVGNAKNGIVYVAAIDQKKMRMEVADHLEGTITDLVASRLNLSVKQYFRNKEYGEGILHMVGQLAEVLNDAKAEQQKLTADELKKKNAQGLPFWAWLLLWPVCFGVLSFVIFRIIRKRREERRRKEQEELIKRTNEQLKIEKRSYELAQQSLAQHQANQQQKRSTYSRPATRSNVISDDPALLYTPPIKSDDDNKSSGSSSGGYGGYSSGSSDSGSSSSSSSSDYGSWGSGSSDSGSSSSDSGYSGGGASDSW